MHEIQIHIVHAQVIEGLLQRRGHVVWMVLIAPEFGRDEDIFAWDATFPDALSDGFLGSVAIYSIIGVERCF